MAESLLLPPSFDGKKVVEVDLSPGQGEQNRHMYDSFDQNPAAKEVLELGADVLGRHPLEVVGNPNLLGRTEWIQPLTYLSSVALREAMKKSGAGEPDIVEGHSLGEYSALVASGALSIEEGLSLVHHRAQVSAEILEDEENDGAMAAVLGMEPEQIDVVLAELEDVWGANDNANDQVVISGRRFALENFERVAQRIYPNLNVRVKVLEIRGAFHSPMVAQAGDKLQPYIAKAKILGARVPLLSPTTAEWVQNAGDIRKVLFDQFTSRVRFLQTVRHIGSVCAQQGVEDVVFVQKGPDKSDAKMAPTRDLSKAVLLNLVNRIWNRLDIENAPRLHLRRVSQLQDIEPVKEYIDTLKK